MALINCPECKKQISDKALSCPNCGNPITAEQKHDSRKNRKRSLIILVTILGVFLIIIIALAVMFFSGAFDKHCADENHEYLQVSKYTPCLSKGSTTYKCKNCNETSIEETAYLEHKLNSDGVCVNCGDVIKKIESESALTQLKIKELEDELRKKGYLIYKKGDVGDYIFNVCTKSVRDYMFFDSGEKFEDTYVVVGGKTDLDMPYQVMGYTITGKRFSAQVKLVGAEYQTISLLYS